MKTKMELKKEINYKINELDFNDLGLFEVSVDEDGRIS